MLERDRSVPHVPAIRESHQLVWPTCSRFSIGAHSSDLLLLRLQRSELSSLEDGKSHELSAVHASSGN